MEDTATTTPTDPGSKQQISASTSLRSHTFTLLFCLFAFDLFARDPFPPGSIDFNNLQLN
jgi:hypothetical protein